MDDITDLREGLRDVERRLRRANTLFQHRHEDDLVEKDSDLVRWFDRDLRAGYAMPDLVRENAHSNAEDPRTGRKRKGKAVQNPTEGNSVDAALDESEPEDIDSKHLRNDGGTGPGHGIQDIQTETTLDRSFAGSRRIDPDNEKKIKHKIKHK